MTSSSGSDHLVHEVNEEEEEDDYDGSSEIVHTMCCKDEDLSLCGIDLSDADFLESGRDYDDDCVVCEDLRVLPKKTRCKICPKVRGDVS